MGIRELKQIHEAHVMNMSQANVIAHFEALGFSAVEVERAVRAEYETEVDAESEGLCE